MQFLTPLQDEIERRKKTLEEKKRQLQEKKQALDEEKRQEEELNKQQVCVSLLCVSTRVND